MSAGRSARARSRKLMWQSSRLRIYGSKAITAVLVGFALSLVDSSNPLYVFWIPIGLFVVMVMFTDTAEYEAKRAEAKRYRTGARTERGTARVLRRLSARRLTRHEQWYIFHDRAIPGSKANIDHIVVGPYGVFNDDSKSRNRRWTIENDNVLYYDGQLVKVDTTLWESSELKKALDRKFGRNLVPVKSCWAIHSVRRLPFRYYSVDGVALLPVGEINAYMASGQKMFTNAEVKQIAEYLNKSFPPYRS